MKIMLIRNNSVRPFKPDNKASHEDTGEVASRMSDHS